MLPISKADLHIHTVHSDGTASVHDVLAHVAASDLDLVAITDHDTIRGAVEAQRLARSFGVEVVVGEEVSTQQGHLLALFIDEELPPGRPVLETIAAVHAQGGLCIAAHPYDWFSDSLGQTWCRTHEGAPIGEQPWKLWPVDGLEVFNASLSWPRITCNEIAQRAAQAAQLPALGSSDSHSLATIGSGWTLFPGRSADDLRRAIQHNTLRWGGSCWSPAQYMEVGWLSVRQRSLRGALEWALSDLPRVYQRHKQRGGLVAESSEQQVVER